MRKLIPLAALAIACISTKTMAHPLRQQDSTKTIHTNDGDLGEWQPGKFETDPETKILYSIDHDKDHLFLAMKIADPAMQMRACMNGMKTFFDTRGKKKEGTGIEFPIRKEGGGFQGGGAEGGDDRTKMQQKMAFNMIVLKTFGFDDKEDKTQFIGEAGSINIGYKFNDDGSLSIEYKVPLEYFGGSASLKNKTMSIGWKINEGGAYTFRATRSEPVQTETRTIASSSRRAVSGAGPTSSIAGGRGGGPSPEIRPVNDEPKGQFIWTKHLMNF